MTRGYDRSSRGDLAAISRHYRWRVARRDLLSRLRALVSLKSPRQILAALLLPPFGDP